MSSASSILSSASSKFFTSDNAALVTNDVSTRPTILPSSTSIMTYSPIGSALDDCTVTTFGFDSPTTNPRLILKPPLNQSHLIVHVYLPVLQDPFLKFYSYCEPVLENMDIR